MSKVRFKQLETGNLLKSQRFYFDGTMWRMFGYEDYASDETIQSFTSTSFQRCLRFTTANIPAGTYELSYQVASNFNRTRYSSEFRILINGSTFCEFKQSTKDTSQNQRSQNSGTRIITLPSGVSNIDLEVKNELSGRRTRIFSPRFFLREAGNSVKQSIPFTCKTKIKQLEQLGATDNQQVRWDGNQFVAVGYFQQAESSAISTTTSTTYQNKLSMNTPANLPLGDYLVRWHWNWYRQSTASDSGFQLIVNNSFPIQTWEVEPKDPSTDQRNCISGLYLYRNLSGANNFLIRYRDLGGSTTGIRAAFINIEQVLTYS